MKCSIQKALVLGLLHWGNPGIAADGDNNAPTLLDCLSEHEGIRAHLEMTAIEAIFSIRVSDSQSYVCKVKPKFTDGRMAVNPHYGASFRLGRCAPELPAVLTGKLRADVGYRMTLFDGKSTLAWIAQSTAQECAVKVNDFERFFESKVPE